MTLYLLSRPYVVSTLSGKFTAVSIRPQESRSRGQAVMILQTHVSSSRASSSAEVTEARSPPCIAQDIYAS